MNNECACQHPTLEDVWCERPAHHMNLHMGYFCDGVEWVSVMWAPQD